MAARARLVPKGSRALEKLFARQRAMTAKLVSLDGCARWGCGSGEMLDQVLDESATISVAQTSVIQELEALLEQLSADDPEAIRRWAEAHVQLLERYLVELESEGETDRIYASSANEARDEWLEVRDGDWRIVDESTSFIRYPKKLYRALFGFAPPG